VLHCQVIAQPQHQLGAPIQQTRHTLPFLHDDVTAPQQRVGTKLILNGSKQQHQFQTRVYGLLPVQMRHGLVSKHQYFFVETLAQPFMHVRQGSTPCPIKIPHLKEIDSHPVEHELKVPHARVIQIQRQDVKLTHIADKAHGPQCMVSEHLTS